MNKFEVLRSIYHDATNLYLISTQPDGKYRYINNAYQKRFLHIHKDLTGQPFNITMHQDDIAAIEATAAKCIQQPERTFPCTIRKVNIDGSYIITQWEFQLLSEEDGSFAGFACLGYDITEFENEKLKSRQLHEFLEDTANALDKKTVLLKELVFDQSHLIRSPLSNILAIVNLLNTMEMSDTLRSMIAMLDTATGQLDNVVKQIVSKSYNEQTSESHPMHSFER